MIIQEVNSACHTNRRSVNLTLSPGRLTSSPTLPKRGAHNPRLLTPISSPDPPRTHFLLNLPSPIHLPTYPPTHRTHPLTTPVPTTIHHVPTHHLPTTPPSSVFHARRIHIAASLRAKASPLKILNLRHHTDRHLLTSITAEEITPNTP